MTDATLGVASCVKEPELVSSRDAPCTGPLDDVEPGSPLLPSSYSCEEVLGTTAAACCVNHSSTLVSSVLGETLAGASHMMDSLVNVKCKKPCDTFRKAPCGDKWLGLSMSDEHREWLYVTALPLGDPSGNTDSDSVKTGCSWWAASGAL